MRQNTHLHAWIALFYSHCVWYPLCPRTQGENNAISYSGIAQVAYACLQSSSSVAKPTSYCTKKPVVTFLYVHVQLSFTTD